MTPFYEFINVRRHLFWLYSGNLIKRFMPYGGNIPRPLVNTSPKRFFRIYRGIIPRELTWVMQSRITQQSHWFITADHQLDMPKLLNAFQQFFREHSKSWIEQFQYKEAGPQLLIQAFLQRIINGGGRINREYALDRKRTDLAIEWPLDEEQGFFGPVQRIVIELKIRYGALDTLITKGLEQTSGYADTFGAEEAYLIVFNRDPETPWEEKIWQRNETCGTREIGVWGM